MTFVWLILTKVRALPGDEQIYVPGSEAIVQCYIPCKSLETALEQLDGFLQAESFTREDIRMAERYEPDSDDQEYPNAIVQKDIAETVRLGRPHFGVFIHSRESAKLAGQPVAPEPSKPWWRFW